MLVIAALVSVRPASAQEEEPDGTAVTSAWGGSGPDPRSDATRSHQACLRDAWEGKGSACFRLWLRAFGDDASPAEAARAERAIASGDDPARQVDAAAHLTVVDPAERDVWVDGRPVGRAPLDRIPLEPGPHVVTLKPSAGGATTRDVVLFAGSEDLVEFKGSTDRTSPLSPSQPGKSPAGPSGAGGKVYDFCSAKNGLSRPRVLMLAPADAERLGQNSDLARVGATELAKEVFVARFPLVRFENVVALAAGSRSWLDQERLPLSEVVETLERAAKKGGDELTTRESQFAAYSAACADDLVVPAITDFAFEWVVTKVKDKKGNVHTVRTAKLEMSAGLAIFRRHGDHFERVARLEASAPSFADTLSDLAIAAMPTTGIAGMDTLDLVSAAADSNQHLSQIPDLACLAGNAPREGVEALLRCSKHGSGRVELAVHAVDERLGPECTAARSDGGDAAIVTCEVRARTFQLTRSLKKQARGVDGWRLSGTLEESLGDDVLALGEKEGIEVGYGFVALDEQGDRLGYYKVTEAGEGGRPSRVQARAGSVPQGTMLQEYPQMGLTIGTLGFAHAVVLNDPPTNVGHSVIAPAPWVAGGELEVGFDLSGVLGSVETHLRIDLGFGGGVGPGANTYVLPTDVWIEKGFYLGDRITLFGAIGGGFQYVMVQLAANEGVEAQTLSAYGGGPAARAGLSIQLTPDTELRLEGIGRGSVVPASYSPEDGKSLPSGWAAREDRWVMPGGRLGLGFIL